MYLLYVNTLVELIGHPNRIFLIFNRELPTTRDLLFTAIHDKFAPEKTLESIQHNN